MPRRQLQDAADDLAVEGLRIELALARDDGVGGADCLLQPGVLGDQPEAGHEPGAQHGQRAAEAPGGPGAVDRREVEAVALEVERRQPVEPAGELDDLLGGGALLRPEDHGGVPERRPHVAGDQHLGAAFTAETRAVRIGRRVILAVGFAGSGPSTVASPRGLKLFDVTDPARPIEVGFYDTGPGGLNAPGPPGPLSSTSQSRRSAGCSSCCRRKAPKWSRQISAHGPASVTCKSSTSQTRQALLSQANGEL